MQKNTVVLLFLGVFSFLCGVTADAATRTVDTAADNAALTACTATANDCSLRGAIDFAASGDVIDFSPTVFAAPTTINLTSALIVFTKDLQINGPGARILTVAAPTLNRAFLLIQGGGLRSVTISGMTIIGGDVSGTGRIDGGVLAYSGSNPDASLTLDGVAVRGGRAINAGGLDLQTAIFHIRNSAIYANTALGNCGGILLNFGGRMTITNSTISGNSGVDHGGGICSQSSTTTIRKSTIAFNSAGTGGGIHSYLGVNLTLGNSIVAHNSGAFATPRPDIWLESNNLPVNFVNEGFNLIGKIDGANESGLRIAAGTPNATQDFAGTIAAPVSARLAPIADNGGPSPTHAFFAGSVAIDHGSAVSGITTDQRGLSRPFDNIYIAPAIGGDGSDIGAFEEQTSLNDPPFIASSGTSRKQGSAASSSQVASLLDAENTSAVTVAVSSANPSNGITVSGIVNTNGVVTADIATSCNASPAAFTLVATDSGSATSTATLNVGILPDTAPILSYAPSVTVNAGGSLSVTPTANGDNGTLGYSILSVSPAMTTSPTVDSNGVVSIPSAQPGGTFTVTIRATDGCGLTTDASFTLNVSLPLNTVTKLSDTNDGVCDSDCSLREAISTAASGDTITFASPLFDTAQTIVLGSELLVAGKTITISGRSAKLTTISGNNLNRVFSVATGAGLTIENLSVINGFDPTTGGGIYNLGTLNVFNCGISANAVFGGSDNYGGGIYNGSFATTNITASTISGNTVSGIANFSNRGGGIANDNGFLTLKNSTVSGNQASGGTNNRGGGIYSQFRNLTLIGVTITGNSLSGSQTSYGGGFFSQQDDVILANSIVSGNSSPNNPNLFGSLNTTNFNLIDADARFLPLGDYGGSTQTHALLADSPAIDGGTTAYNPGTHGTTDQRGSDRVIGGRIDIGAFERNISFNQTSLPDGNTSLFYLVEMSASRQASLAGADQSRFTENLAPFSFSLVTIPGQGLPPGLTLSTEGILSGQPTVGGTFTFTVKATDTDGQAGLAQFSIMVLVPTASNASVSGRVLTADGSGIRNALVVITDANGNVRTTRSTTFGFYRFDDLPTGETYVLGAEAKRFRFTPRILTVDESLTEVNLVAQ